MKREQGVLSLHLVQWLTQPQKAGMGRLTTWAFYTRDTASLHIQQAGAAVCAYGAKIHSYNILAVLRLLFVGFLQQE